MRGLVAAAGLVACWLLGAVALADDAPLLADAGAEAPGASDELQLFQLDDLLHTQTSVASQKARTVRETPGIVTLITRDEMQAWGARDLIDVLRMVPGFEFAGDEDDTVVLTFRGNNAEDGKILFMIDGIDQTDLLYANTVFGNHYPVDSIQRIEIIRGGGSVLYGNSAEYAVINVITVGANELQGFQITGLYGQMEQGLGQLDLDVNYGQTLLNGDLKLSFNGVIGKGSRTDGVYTDYYGISTSFANDQSSLNPLLINASVQYKGLKLHFLYDDLRSETAEGTGYVLNYPLFMRWSGYYLTAQYDWKIGDFTITPRFSYQNQHPWQIQNLESFYDKSVEKWDGRVVADWVPTKDLDVTLGVEGWLTEAFVDQPALDSALLAQGYNQLFFGTDQSAQIHDFAYFGEVSWDNPVVDVTVGARLENNSGVGHSLVPRAALTKAFGRFHAKLLYSQAFRAPMIEELSLAQNVLNPGCPNTTEPFPDPNCNLKPEQTYLGEAEVGYQILDSLFVTANAFYMVNTNALIYLYNSATNVEGYQNGQQTGTKGLEAELRYSHPRWGNLTVNGSLYSALGVNQAETYGVPGLGQQLLGAPQVKIAANAAVHVWRGLTFDPQLIWESAKWGYLPDPTAADGNQAMGAGVIGRLPPVALLNLYLRYRDLVIKGLDVGVGVYNLLDADYQFVQAYNPGVGYGGVSYGHAPIPGPSRDWVGRISYTLVFP